MHTAGLQWVYRNQAPRMMSCSETHTPPPRTHAQHHVWHPALLVLTLPCKACAHAGMHALPATAIRTTTSIFTCCKGWGLIRAAQHPT